MIEIRLMGGLGNQMFQYAMLRATSLEFGDTGVIDLSGLSNKTHNVYTLDNLNISDEIKLIDKSKHIRAKLNYLIYGYYFVFLQKSKNGFKRLLRIQRVFQPFGMYCIPDAYGKIQRSNSKYKTLVGYFTSNKYFIKYEDVIRKELKVKKDVLKQNVKLLEDITKSNSVCLHIRRGDYIGTNLQVCTDKYYMDAVKLMNEKIKNPTYYIFSDDIEWVKNHFDFGKNVVFVDKNNPNYEDLRLMYSCKHFIISNSTFSWWAQFLSDNKDKVVIAPSIWYTNPNIKCDLYEDSWITLDVK